MSKQNTKITKLCENCENTDNKIISICFRSTMIIRSTKVNFMWCVFHNAQWYWSDNLCKLATDQWRGSLGVRDSESCWFTEEIGTYMSCWESPGDLPLVIEMFVSFRSFRSLHSRKDITFLSLVEDHPFFPKNVCKNLLMSMCANILQDSTICSENVWRICIKKQYGPSTENSPELWENYDQMH
jgi:hypothetical protein